MGSEDARFRSLIGETIMVDPESVKEKFRERFGGAPRVFRAPGRVNLIGEHTDYNDGFVLPMAVEFDTVVAAAPRNDRHILVHSLTLGESREIDLDAPAKARRGDWVDYVEGVARVLEARGLRLAGANLVLHSDVPVGAGLSSSAALEVSTGLALASISGYEIDGLALALAGQRAEHVYVGTRSGIMDQFVAALAKSDHALIIDCRALTSASVPVRLPGTQIVICDSRVSHSLAGSEYNTRRGECEAGVTLLKAWRPSINSLRDVGPEEFEGYESRLPEPIRRRCRHVVTENVRTLSAAAALTRVDVEELGKLMVASHASLRDDYEVSCVELDLLVEFALSVDGVYGARMTGGGFGGCTVNLVRDDALEEFAHVVCDRYNRAAQRDPAVYVSRAAVGAREVV
jgi:galactokinase